MSGVFRGGGCGMLLVSLERMPPPVFCCLAVDDKETSLIVRCTGSIVKYGVVEDGLKYAGSRSTGELVGDGCSRWRSYCCRQSTSLRCCWRQRLWAPAAGGKVSELLLLNKLVRADVACRWRGRQHWYSASRR